ncbi:hypothetical protein EB796_023703 [Bugula neritina]|uniref:Uncharacterized protein n=1 Tax=Bugula neritina TaxID=10212 RepID=A0A7J7IX52_BUGNE|nr:hypothetical protein EB796_023703 [Bugula neritina]
MRKTQEINRSAQAILQKHLETNQHEARKNNAIVYGIEEKEEMTALNQVKDLMKNYCFQHSDAQPDRQPKSAIRLRTSGPVDPNRPRPIKVEFTSEASKWEFIKRANASLRSLNVFVKPDESKEKREEQYALRQRIRDLKHSPDTDGEYRIRSLKIQKKDPVSGKEK